MTVFANAMALVRSEFWYGFAGETLPPPSQADIGEHSIAFAPCLQSTHPVALADRQAKVLGFASPTDFARSKVRNQSVATYLALLFNFASRPCLLQKFVEGYAAWPRYPIDPLLVGRLPARTQVPVLVLSGTLAQPLVLSRWIAS